MSNVEVVLARHEERMVMCNDRFRGIEERIQRIEASVCEIKTNTTRILSGVVVASVLMVLNMLVMFAQGRLI